jgi:hypothetical protein
MRLGISLCDWQDRMIAEKFSNVRLPDRTTRFCIDSLLTLLLFSLAKSVNHGALAAIAILLK